MGRDALALSLLLGIAFVVGCNSATVAPAPEAGGAHSTSDGFVTIHNDFNWVDHTGARILTRSGCLCQFNGVFYWYGGNPRGFREQYCYSSTDLVHWTNKGV